MENTKLVSIIVPIYNVEEYLDKNITSILSQTYKNFELLLIDDGSTDKSLEICLKYSKIDKRIKVFHKSNGGLSDARNYGLKQSKGEFIGFVDGDDFIEPDMYDSLITACEANNTLISMAGRYNVSSDQKVPKFTFKTGKIFDSKIAIKRLLLSKNIDSSACDKLFHKSLFEKIIFPLNKYNEDIFVMVHLIDQARNIYHIGSPKYNYVIRGNSITNNKFTPKKMDLIEACREVLYFVNTNYKSLYFQARSFYAKNIIYLKASFDKDDNNSMDYFKENKRLSSEFNSIILDIFFNPFIPLIQRLIGYLILLDLLKFFRRIFNK
jgi:glycosyltransferase involved in cell wall biosynthesis